MTDTPASWQPDPTGRHDHRYWDGTQWTDHVADAGVAATDPYDGPGDAVDEAGPPEAEGELATTWSGGAADGAPAGTEASLEAAPAADAGDEAEAEAADGGDGGAPAVSAGWGGASEPDAGDEPVATTTEPPAPATASGWARPDEPAPTVSGWGATATPPWSPAGSGTAEGDEPAAAAATDEVTAVTPTGSWGEATTATSPVGDATSTWGAAPSVEDPYATAAPAPASPEPPEEGSNRRKLLLLLVALAVIIGVIVALVVVGGDDDDSSGGDGDAIAQRISETLQDDLDMEEGPADCIGDHIVDEIGAARLQDVDFSAPEAPADLEDDFNEAFNDAIGVCDLDPSDLGRGGGDEGASGDDETRSTLLSSSEFRQSLAETWQSTLGLSEEKATCLADQMASAVERGEHTQDEAYGEFFQYLDPCQISLEELTPTTAAG